MNIFNLNSDEWDGERGREGWRGRGALVGQRLGGELIGATMSEVEPGSKLWPYHTHYFNEEWAIVLRGEPTLRTPEGEHVLSEVLAKDVEDEDIMFARETSSASRAARKAHIRSSTEQTR